MQVVEVVICNSTYKISCETEKKDHLLRLVDNFNRLVSSISKKTKGKGSDALNFLLAALTLEDKVLELTQQLEKISKENEKYQNEKEREYVKILDKVDSIITSLEYVEN